MHAPYPLYVDELSPDGVKAVVSNVNSFFRNIATIMSAMGKDRITEALGDKINGVAILPVGRFVCLMSRAPKVGREWGARGMVLLDLTGRLEIGYKIAEQFESKELEDRFMEVLAEIVRHPENLGQYDLVVGKPPGNKIFG